jgi:ribonucleoside-diphosphate reductase beta chain
MFIMRSLSPVFEERTYYKPFEYPWAFDYYTIQNQLHWLPEDVPMHEDVKDWNQKLSPSEKNLLTQIFRLFTQSDVDVGSGYYEKYIPMFKKPELRMMMGSFANMESIHQHAYSLLLDTVGMPESEYKAFAKYEEMSAKHDYIHQFKTGEVKTKKDLKDVAKALAVYSGFTEGLQLFSSFAILINFQRFNKMKGMCKIVEHEDKFIELVFEMGDVQGLTLDEMKKYNRYIADRRLLQLGLKPNFGISDNPLTWWDEVIGVEHQNFFEGRASAYTKASVKGNWSNVFDDTE